MNTLTIAAATVAAITFGATAADAASTCQGVARHMQSGSVLLGSEPLQIVPARRGRCLLILSGWSNEANDPPETGGSAGVNIGDANVDSSGTGGFVPNDTPVLELQTEDEVWAVVREGHLPQQVITWLELFD